MPWQPQRQPKIMLKKAALKIDTRGTELLHQCRTPGSERSSRTFPARAPAGLTAGYGVLSSQCSPLRLSVSLSGRFTSPVLWRTCNVGTTASGDSHISGCWGISSPVCHRTLAGTPVSTSALASTSPASASTAKSKTTTQPYSTL